MRPGIQDAKQLTRVCTLKDTVWKGLFDVALAVLQHSPTDHTHKMETMHG